MSNDYLTLARRLERAQGLQNDRFNAASGGRSLAVGGGFAHFRGTGHPLNQALGLIDPISEAQLAEVEGFLGSPTVLELSPAADPELWPLLARRGYRLHMFQQLWTRTLEGDFPEGDPRQVRPAQVAEADTFNRLVAAGFMGQDDWQAADPSWGTPLGLPDAWGFLVFEEGEPAGGGMLGIADGIAILSGDGVLPRFRGRGLQKALIRARLAFAKARGCDVACASTAPSTPSQRAYEACGFRVAYPKVEMAKD